MVLAEAGDLSPDLFYGLEVAGRIMTAQTLTLRT